MTLVMCGSAFNIPAPAANVGGEQDDAPIIKIKSISADGDTGGEWNNALDKNGVGYVWTDKTVKASQAGKDSFDITYSDIACSREDSNVEIEQPVDLVLVIDQSGSMGNVASEADEPNSRMRKMVKAVNETIDEVMEKSPYNRVSVVTFHDYYSVVLPLDHYKRLDYSDPVIMDDKDNGKTWDLDLYSIWYHDKYGEWYEPMYNDSRKDVFIKNEQNKVDYIQITQHWVKSRHKDDNGDSKAVTYWYNLGGYAIGDKYGKIHPTAKEILASGYIYDDSERFFSPYQGRTEDGRTKILDYYYNNGERKVTEYFSSSGTTNIQGGIYKGMDVLLDSAAAGENKITIPGTETELTRKPVLVLMTDGGATNCMDGVPWDLSDDTPILGYSNFKTNPTYPINANNVTQTQGMVEDENGDTKEGIVELVATDGMDYHEYINKTLFDFIGGKNQRGDPDKGSAGSSRQDTTVLLLATLMTAAYYKAEVKEAYGVSDFPVSAIAMDMDSDNKDDSNKIEWLRSSILFNPNKRFKGGTWAHGTSTSTLERDYNNTAFGKKVSGGWDGEALKVLGNTRNMRWMTWWADQAYKDYESWFTDNSKLEYEYARRSSSHDTVRMKWPGQKGKRYLRVWYPIENFSIPQADDDVRKKINDNIYTWLSNDTPNPPCDIYSPYYISSSDEAVESVKGVFTKAFLDLQKYKIPVSPILPSSALTYTDTIGAGMHIDGNITLDTGISDISQVTINLDENGMGNGPDKAVTDFLGNQVNLNNIIVKVSPVSVSGDEKQTITITIPENLIPVKLIHGDTGTSTDVSPFKFTYRVKLNDGWDKLDLTEKNSQKFYSNVSATTEFIPNIHNKFYAETDTGGSWDTPKKNNKDINGKGKPADDQEYDGSKVTVIHDNNGVINVSSDADLTVDLDFSKVSIDGVTPLPGAEFALAHDSSCECRGEDIQIDNQTSGADGKFTFTDVSAGHTYTLTEISAPDGYLRPDGSLATVTVDDSGNVSVSDKKDGFFVDDRTIKNMYEPEYTSLTVKKEWKYDKPATRPKNVKVQLLKDNNPEGAPVELTGDDWSYTWDRLVAKDEYGAEHSYSVEEVDVPNGYTDSVSGIDNGTITITNTYTDAYLTIEKYIDKLYYYSTADGGDNPHGFNPGAGIGKIEDEDNDNHGYLNYTQAEQNFVFEVKKYSLNDTEYVTPLSTSYVILKFGADAERLPSSVQTPNLPEKQYNYKDSTRVKVESGYAYVVTEVGIRSGLSWRYECDCMKFSTESSAVTAVLRLDHDTAAGSDEAHENGALSVNYNSGGEATVSFYNSRTAESENVESDMSSVKNSMSIT